MYNHHRANIRNAMVPMTLEEALKFQRSLDDKGDIRGSNYAEEFLCELEEDFDPNYVRYVKLNSCNVCPASDG